MEAWASQATRHSDAGRPTDLLEDAQLLALFGWTKTLEELDHIDLGRHLRAKEAERLVQLEARRSLFVSGQLDELTDDEWRQIDEIDRALNTGTTKVTRDGDK